MLNNLTIKQKFATLCAALLLSGVSFGLGSAITGRATAQTAPTIGQYDKHPRMLQARRDLLSARGQLQAGSDELGGHRAKALDLTNQAISECNAAIEYGKAH